MRRGCCRSRRAPSRPATSPPSRPRSAGDWSTSGCRPSGRSRWARPTSSSQEKFGISRERQDEFAARSHNLAARGLGRRVLRRPRRAGAGRRARPRRGHPTRLDGREAGRAEAVLPRATARSPRATPPRSTTALPRVLLGSEPRRRPLGRDPIARIAGRGASALEPQLFGYAPVEAADLALARAGITWADVGASSSTRRSPCSRSPASTPGRSTRRSSTPGAARSRSVTRSAPRAVGSSAPSPRLREDGRPLGRGGDLHRRRAGARRRPGERRHDA